MNKYYTFKRGSVVMVDFSPQVGSEIKGKHFAIVLTKKDRRNNELLTVIPLTSKFHKSHIDFGEEIYIDICIKILKHINSILKDFNEVNKHYQKTIEERDDFDESVLINELYNDVKNSQTLEKIDKNVDLCTKVLNIYDKLKKTTYGKPQQITTISKNRILKPINQYDPIRNLTVSNAVMDKIDEAIIKLFTK